MDRGLAAAGQTDVRFGRRVSRPRRGLGRPLRVPRRLALDLEAERIVSVIDDRADLLRVPEPDHQLELGCAEFLSSSTDSGTFGSTISASPTRPSPSRSSVSTALILAPWSGTVISWRKPLPHSGQVHVAQLSRVVLVAASSSTRRIVSTSSAAVSAKAGLTPDGAFGAVEVSASGSVRDDGDTLAGVAPFCLLAGRHGL